MANAAALKQAGTEPEQQSEDAAPPKKRNRGKLLALVALLALCAGGAGAFFAYEPEIGPAPRAEAVRPPQYVNLETS